MNTAQKILGAVLVTAAVGTSIVAAQTTNTVSTTSAKTTTSTEAHTRLSLAQHEALRTLVEKGDYTGWKALMATDGLSADTITAEKFAKMTELSKLEIQAEALRKEIGPVPGMGMGLGKGMGKGGMMRGGEGKGQNMAAIKALPQTVQDELKAAFEKHDITAVDKILKDNGITPPTRPAHDQDPNVNSTSSTTQQ